MLKNELRFTVLPCVKNTRKLTRGQTLQIQNSYEIALKYNAIPASVKNELCMFAY
ncbi:hypothetical protein I533_19030 [Alteromonas mediterranea MED64]|uniref:Uncharacterized protein n=1 Tax=Alteromonas mediterranea 615 TaxID=1300253 RepID=S5AIR1_9ALTE|nr:hypothetical protein I633_21180 [Alteromonas mediterranea 615]AGP83755.1 hypothetical protein I533_19030 [Alteromonas mediterranea MED64]AGP87560.1 hypothetical protein I607_18960 [Alteromonas mediterranea U4]AGP91696.1 hypothetical protein I876_19330 [Alteromonas mediterranea U7]AGP95496.1 hypothetical protein I634_19100 [Alteromonas mediterranea U8]